MSNISRFSHYTLDQLVEYIEKLECENMRLRQVAGVRKQLRIEDTELSGRTVSRLVFADIVFLTDLTKFSKDDLLKLRGVGNKMVSEIEEVLKKHGLKLSL